MKKALLMFILLVFAMAGCIPKIYIEQPTPEPTKEENQTYLLVEGQACDITEDYYISGDQSNWAVDLKDGTILFQDDDYHNIKYLNDGLFSMNETGYTTVGLVDKDGIVYFRAKYDDIGKYNDGLASVSKDGVEGFIDKSGNEVIALEYDEASDFEYGVAWVRKNDRFALIDTKGNIIIGPVESAATPQILGENLFWANACLMNRAGEIFVTGVDYEILNDQYILLRSYHTPEGERRSGGLMDFSGNIVFENGLPDRYCFNAEGVVPIISDLSDKNIGKKIQTGMKYFLLYTAILAFYRKVWPLYRTPKQINGVLSTRQAIW